MFFLMKDAPPSNLLKFLDTSAALSATSAFFANFPASPTSSNFESVPFPFFNASATSSTFDTLLTFANEVKLSLLDNSSVDLLEIPDDTGAESEIEVDIFFNRWRLFDSETDLINFASMSILEILFIDETLLVCLIPSEIEPNISSVDDGTKFENFLTAEAVSAILEVTRVVDATLENVPAIALKSSFFNNDAVPDTYRD